MKIIRTTPEMREYYEKHLNKLYDYAEGNFEDDNCYMCMAEYEKNGDCSSCPLDHPEISCSGAMRKINLRTPKGLPTYIYESATPESIRKHALWIEKQITDKTDCEFDTI